MASILLDKKLFNLIWAAPEIAKFAYLPSFLSQTTQPFPYPEKSSFKNFFPSQHFLDKKSTMEQPEQCVKSVNNVNTIKTQEQRK